MRIVKLSTDTRQDLLENLLKRSTNDYGDYEKVVADIIGNVKERREEAIFEYSLKFDKCALTRENFKVTREEIDAAYQKLDAHFVQVMRDSAANIRAYHERQKRNSWFDAREDGTILGQKITPMQNVGVYVPGGKAAYPSTTLMNVVPARVAGVPNIVMTRLPVLTAVSIRRRSSRLTLPAWTRSTRLAAHRRSRRSHTVRR